ncbi:MAG: hypothetical protein HQL95_03715 [Magnetococcales bacterium]|nr:hypothetical protein [Magnetococcales bacterium]
MAYSSPANRHRLNAPRWMMVLVLLLSGCASTTPGRDTACSQPGRAEPGAPCKEALLEPVQWKVGQWWQYDDGYTLEVEQVDAKTGIAHLIRKDSPGAWIERRHFFPQASQDADGTERTTTFTNPDPKEFLNTMNEGNITGKIFAYEREYVTRKPGETKGKRQTHMSSWRVLGKAKVVIPEGTYSCWILEWKTTNPTTGWMGYEKWYYSPEVGNYVRLEYRYEDQEGTRVLVAKGDHHPANKRDPSRTPATPH